MLDRALPLDEGAGDLFGLPTLLGNVGMAALLSGDLARAGDAFLRQVRLSRKHVFRHAAAEGVGGLAAIAAAEGESDRAARLLGAAGDAAVGSRGVVDELERRFFASARSRAGPAAWAGAQARGAQMSFAEAIRTRQRRPDVDRFLAGRCVTLASRRHGLLRLLPNCRGRCKRPA